MAWKVWKYMVIYENLIVKMNYFEVATIFNMVFNSKI